MDDGQCEGMRCAHKNGAPADLTSSCTNEGDDSSVCTVRRRMNVRYIEGCQQVAQRRVRDVPRTAENFRPAVRRLRYWLRNGGGVRRAPAPALRIAHAHTHTHARIHDVPARTCVREGEKRARARHNRLHTHARRAQRGTRLQPHADVQLCAARSTHTVRTPNVVPLDFLFWTTHVRVHSNNTHTHTRHDGRATRKYAI